jgi:hypothetical protein
LRITYTSSKNKKWLKEWIIKVNESKSSHTTFTLRNGHCSAVNINQTIIPETEVVKYRRTALRLQVELEEHIDRKMKQIDLKAKEINWLRGKKSHLSIGNKLFIYKAVIRPIWSYGI